MAFHSLDIGVISIHFMQEKEREKKIYEQSPYENLNILNVLDHPGGERCSSQR